MADWATHKLDPIAKKQRRAEDVSEEERKIFDDVFKRFTEISDALDNLKLCLGFIRAPMPRGKTTKLDRHLAYHLTFYIQEIYILRERLESYAKVIMRTKKRRDRTSIAADRYDHLVSKVNQSLENIVKIRGAHVHSRPFNDGTLEELSLYSFLAIHKSEYRGAARLAYRNAKATWVKRLKDNEAAIDALLDEYFDFMFIELTTGNVEPLFPDFSFKF